MGPKGVGLGVWRGLETLGSGAEVGSGGLSLYIYSRARVVAKWTNLVNNIYVKRHKMCTLGLGSMERDLLRNGYISYIPSAATM